MENSKYEHWLVEKWWRGAHSYTSRVFSSGL